MERIRTSLCRTGDITLCSQLQSRPRGRNGERFKLNKKQSDFFILDFSVPVPDKIMPEDPYRTTKLHLLRGFVVAWTGHVGYVGRYGLDLPHELISNPGVVLQQ